MPIVLFFFLFLRLLLFTIANTKITSKVSSDPPSIDTDKASKI